ncbi:MAG: aspartate aminotransferase family protein [Fimbriimonas sp.]
MPMDADTLYLEVIEKTSRHLNPYLARLQSFAGFGIETRAEGCTIWDHEGRAYLDCLGGYGTFSLGHRHPRVVEAVKRQLDQIALGGKAFFSQNAGDLAEMLAEITPAGLEFSFFCNSGAEAVEAALKFAKGSTGRAKIVSTQGSYHGKTLGALATTGREKYRKRFEPLMPGVVFVPYDDIEAAVAEIDDETAAMIVEPIQGEGGIIVPQDGYLAALRKACDEHGALLIFDEVQTGLGRTGLMFGCDHEGVAPDLMTLAKSLGGGIMPLGALVGTPTIWESIYSVNPMAHTSTFGASPIACAAGIAAIQTLREEGLVERSAQMGARLLAGLQSVADRHNDLVLPTRGRGLMIGLEFRQDEVGEIVVAMMMKHGLCVAYALNNPRVLRYEPPFVITEEQVDFAVETTNLAVQDAKELLGSLV